MGSMIPDGSRVLLDTVAVIYFLEESGRYSRQAESIFGRIEVGDLQGVMANLVFADSGWRGAGKSPAGVNEADRLLLAPRACFILASKIGIPLQVGCAAAF